MKNAIKTGLCLSRNAEPNEKIDGYQNKIFVIHFLSLLTVKSDKFLAVDKTVLWYAQVPGFGSVKSKKEKFLDTTGQDF